MENIDLTREQLDDKLESIDLIKSKISHLKGHMKELSYMSGWSLMIHKIGNNGDISLNTEGFDKQSILDAYLKACNEKLDKLYEELKNILTINESNEESTEGNT